MLPMGLQAIYDQETWIGLTDKQGAYPLIQANQIGEQKAYSSTLNFVQLEASELNDIFLEQVQSVPQAVLIISSKQQAKMPEIRNAFFFLEQNNYHQPVIIRNILEDSLENTMLYTSTDTGSLLIDGFGDGIMISNKNCSAKRLNDISAITNAVTVGEDSRIFESLTILPNTYIGTKLPIS